MTFDTNDVFRPTTLVPKIDGSVRVIQTVGLEKVVLIAVDEGANSVPFGVDYRDWLGYLKSGDLELTEDPHIRLSSLPGKLPKSTTERYKEILQVTETLTGDPIYGIASQNSQKMGLRMAPVRPKSGGCSAKVH